ncbi:MAG: M28 family peptidase [Lentisphaeria bacterium]|nr:M28 family peptidase [Lentisphaeria bacterium]
MAWSRFVAGAIPLIMLFSAALPMLAVNGASSPVAKVPVRIATAEKLRNDVEYFSRIGERNYTRPGALIKSAKYIRERFSKAGLEVEELKYQVNDTKKMPLKFPHATLPKKEFTNIIGSVVGTKYPEEIIIVGAHYDTPMLENGQGADDNASGLAGMLALAEYFGKNPQERTIRFIAFANEEMPFFNTKDMGSYRCAANSAALQEKVVAMIALECIGYFSEEKNSQKIPLELKLENPPRIGNFIAIIGNENENALVEQTVAAFKQGSNLPVIGLAASFEIAGLGWSDHASYAKFNIPAIMITDTALLRNSNYHQLSDTPETLNYEKMNQVVVGTAQIIHNLALGGEGKSEKNKSFLKY